MLSRLIKLYTKDEYTHVSIALDEKLDRLYSFGRLNPYNAFVGGFVHEGVHIGTFNRFKKTIAGIYQLEVTDEEYSKIESLIAEFESNRKKYKFNIKGMFCTVINLKIEKENYFYCAEFVKYVLENAEIKTDLPDIVKPNDFQYIKGLEILYKGYLQQYV